MNNKSIVDRVKAIAPRYQSISVEDRIALAIAYANGEIGLTQIVKTVWPNRKGSGMTRAYCAICSGLKEGVRSGKIKIVK